MKIVLIDHFNEEFPGGGQEFLKYVFKILAKEGHKITVVCLPNSCVQEFFSFEGFNVYALNFYSKFIIPG